MTSEHLTEHERAVRRELALLRVKMEEKRRLRVARAALEYAKLPTSHHEYRQCDRCRKAIVLRPDGTLTRHKRLANGGGICEG